MPETSAAKPRTAGRPKKNPSETEWKAHLKAFVDLQERVAMLEKRTSEHTFIDKMIAHKAAMDAGRLPKAKLVKEYIAAALALRAECYTLLDE